MARPGRVAEHLHGPDCAHDHGAHPVPYRRADTKRGRNEPCFCGSGRKYKRCHGVVGQARSS